MTDKRLAELEALRRGGIAYVRRMCGGPNGLSWEDAEDIVSDVIVKFWEHGKDGAGNLPALFFTACKNRAIDMIRSRQAAKNQPVEMRGGASNEERLEARVILGEILAGLPTLNEDRRRAVELRLLGYGEAELADVLGCPISASKKRVYRGIAALRAAGVGA